MGILDDIMKAATTPGPRTALLQQFTLAQLKELAAEHGVELKSDGNMFEPSQPLKTKPEIVEKLANSNRALPTNVIEAYGRKHGIAASPTHQPKTAPATPSPPPTPPVDKPSTPAADTRTQVRTIQTPPTPTGPTPTTSFEELLSYVRAYNFMANYDAEASYQAELAGALRERYGSIVRKEYPVPVVGKRRTIDIDVGGIGIEIKANLRTGVSLRNARAQLEEYIQHYGSNLIFVLIGTHGYNAEKHDIRALPITFLDR